jgi:predicted ester cyclase
MSTPMEVVKRHFAAFKAKDADAEPFSADAEVVEPGGQLRGREQILDWLGGYWQAFPDARLEAVHSVESGSRAAVEGRFVGTHTGPLRTPAGEVPPTGRSVEVRWMAMYEIAGEQLMFEHLYFDPSQFMTQLGLAPEQPAQAAVADS